MIAHRHYPLNTDYETFMKSVKAIYTQPPTISDVLAERDAEVASLQAEVLRLNLELAALKAKTDR